VHDKLSAFGRFFILKMITLRFKSALKASAIHILGGVIVLALLGFVVFHYWYPCPYQEIQGGANLFFLIALIDVVCGPILTFIIWNPLKAKSELTRDMLVVIVVQAIALAYGLNTLINARPVFLAFEGDRFRVVSAIDIDKSKMHDAPLSLQKLSWVGPQLVGVKLFVGTDPEFLQSVQNSLKGIYPSYDPSRWILYESVTDKVLGAGKVFSDNDFQNEKLRKLIEDSKIDKINIIYYPLAGFLDVDWVVVLDKRTGFPAGFLKMNGW
jgi:hypothetical protein